MSINSLGNAARMTERLSHILQESPQAIEVGVHMAERLPHIARMAQSASHLGPRVIVAGERIPQALASIDNLNNVHNAKGNRLVNKVVDVLKDLDQRAGRILYRVTGQASRDAAREAAKEQALQNLKDLGEAGLDILEGIGWAAAGDLEMAQDRLVDGALKTGDVFIRNLPGPGGG
jgi:uncharacterized protein (DUF2252 family)